MNRRWPKFTNIAKYFKLKLTEKNSRGKADSVTWYQEILRWNAIETEFYGLSTFLNDKAMLCPRATKKQAAPFLFSKPWRVLNDNKQARNLFLGIAHTGSIIHSSKSSVMFFVPGCDVVCKVKRASIFFQFFFFRRGRGSCLARNHGLLMT